MLESYLLIEDNRVISEHPDEASALAAMKAEHKKDIFGIIAKRRILNLFVAGKYKIKEYRVVKVLTVKTIDNDSDIGGIF